MKIWWIAIAVLIIPILGISYWYYEHSLWEQLPDNKYISEIKKDGVRVRVRLPDEKSVHQLVDTSYFHNMETGYSFDDVIEKYGKPQNITESKGTLALEYWFDDGRVHVEREESASSVSWSLSAFPNGIDYKSILCKEIAERIDPENEESIVVIDTSEDLLMLVVVSGYRVNYISWLYTSWKSNKS